MRMGIFSLSVGIALVETASFAFAASNFESPKLSSGMIIQGGSFQSPALRPGVVVQGSSLQSPKLSPGIVVGIAGLESVKLSVGIVVQVVPGGGVGAVPRAPLTHW